MAIGFLKMEDDVNQIGETRRSDEEIQGFLSDVRRFTGKLTSRGSVLERSRHLI